ncbi:hypothetical protein NC652_000481 [Populus alba x Populus x berolinensis]|nr:hypothetical protein NC652_000481 [Populus alba x Populus x berolinensis]
MASNVPLRNLLSLVQNRSLKTSTVPPNTSSPSSFTVQYLLSSPGLHLESVHSDAHIAKLIHKWPAVLHCKVEHNLKPKFEFFIENGFVGEILPELIVSNPDKVIAASKRSVFLLTCDWNSIVQPNVDFLIKEGVPVDRVAKLFLFHPQVVQRKHDRMDAHIAKMVQKCPAVLRCKVEDNLEPKFDFFIKNGFEANYLKNLGLEPKAPMFIHAFRVMVQLSEPTWKKKIEAWKSVGWSEGEILGTFKRFPFLLSCSEEKINCMMDFFVNTVKLGHQTITANPSIFKYSFDKRIFPRYNVLKVLESKKLIRVRKTATFLKISEEKFLENYITKYEGKVPAVDCSMFSKELVGVLQLVIVGAESKSGGFVMVRN